MIPTMPEGESPTQQLFSPRPISCIPPPFLFSNHSLLDDHPHTPSSLPKPATLPSFSNDVSSFNDPGLKFHPRIHALLKNLRHLNLQQLFMSNPSPPQPPTLTLSAAHLRSVSPGDDLNERAMSISPPSTPLPLFRLLTPVSPISDSSENASSDESMDCTPDTPFPSPAPAFKYTPPRTDLPPKLRRLAHLPRTDADVPASSPKATPVQPMTSHLPPTGELILPLPFPSRPPTPGEFVPPSPPAPCHSTRKASVSEGLGSAFQLVGYQPRQSFLTADQAMKNQIKRETSPPAKVRSSAQKSPKEKIRNKPEMAVTRVRRVVLIVQQEEGFVTKSEAGVGYRTMTAEYTTMDVNAEMDETDADADDEEEETDEFDKDDESYLPPPPSRNYPSSPTKPSVKKPPKEKPKSAVSKPKKVSTKNCRGAREKTYPCPHEGCNEIYTRLSDANRHGARCPKNPKGSQGVRCPQCCKWLSREDALSRHLKRNSCQRSGQSTT